MFHHIVLPSPIIISFSKLNNHYFYYLLLSFLFSCKVSSIMSIILPMRKSQLLSQRSPTLSTSAHIVQDNLDRKGQLIERYRNSTQGDILKIDSHSRNGRHPQEETPRRTPHRDRLRSFRKELPSQERLSEESMNDYQKLILGLQYNLEGERKKREGLESRNQSLETEISNLRNLLLGPEQQKQHERTAFKEYQDKIISLEQRVIDQKHNYQFIIDSKNQALASLEFQLRALEKRIREEQSGRDDGGKRRVLELMGELQQQRATIAKKNILIQKLKYHVEEPASDSDDEAVKQVGRGNRLAHYLQQLQISSKLILRKNIEILNNNKKILKYEEVLDVIEHYLDKKEVKNVDIKVLEHACVNKLRLLMREKAVFQRQLLGQLNEHNKKIAGFEQQILQRDSVNGNKMIQVVNDNKRLSSLVGTLQNTIKNLEKSLEDAHRQEELLNSQIQINKRQFVEDVRKLKDELGTISSVTKNQFDRMKLENIKLAEQNKSLLFLVGEKEKELMRKGESIKVFEQYKDKINSLNVDATVSRKIEAASEDAPQIGTKLVLINTFSQWMMQWNKIRNWNNKKVLLNIILDKQEIRSDSINSMSNLIAVLHECLLSSKNIQIQQRSIILLAHYLPHGILKSVNLFLDKVAPIITRGFRSLLEGQDPQKHRLLNQAALKIVSGMQKNEFRWSGEMTNEMLSVNGLKCLFGVVSGSKVDQLVENSYNCLIMIAKQNEMVSFMNSFNVATLLLQNLTPDYPFLSHALHLLGALLRSRDFIKSQKSLLQFRKIFSLLKEGEEEENATLTLECSLALMDNSLFVKSLNKIEILSILSQAFRNHSDYHILKKIGEAYAILVAELQTENMPRLGKEVSKLLDIIKTRKFGQNRFNRALRIILKVVEIITDSPDLDEKILEGVVHLYQHFQAMQGKSRLKLNSIISIIHERNKELVNKFSNEDWIVSLVQAYKQSSSNEQMVFLLKLLQFQHEQKRSTEILRAGREALISKLISDALLPDYNVALPALRNLLSISKEKYAQKFVNKGQFSKLVNKVLASRHEEEYIGSVISILYYFCKSEDSALIIIQLDLVEKIFRIISERHEKEGLIYKCLTLLELCHTTHYKRKILNYLLTNDNNLQMLKTVNFVLKKAKNKQEMGARAVFLYDFLNGKTAVESLGLLVQQNPWMVEDLIDLRNQYVSKVDPLVYKIQLLLHNMSTVNQKVRKLYQKFKIEGEYESEDDK